MLVDTNDKEDRKKVEGRLEHGWVYIVKGMKKRAL